MSYLKTFGIDFYQKYIISETLQTSPKLLSNFLRIILNNILLTQTGKNIINSYAKYGLISYLCPSMVTNFSFRLAEAVAVELFCKKVVPKNFAISQENTVLESLFNKVAGPSLRPVTLLKRLQHRCFPLKFAKFLRTLILKSICE